MKKVLIATEKPFAPVAIKDIKDIFDLAGYECLLLEKYTDKQQLIEAVAEVDGLIVRSDKIDDAVMAAAPNLKIIVRAGAGYDNIDLAAATAHGIVVMNTPGQNANAVAELVIGLLIYTIRNQFDGSAGTELMGKKLGLMAYGAVAQHLGRIANLKLLTPQPSAENHRRRISRTRVARGPLPLQRHCEPAHPSHTADQRYDWLRSHYANEKRSHLGQLRTQRNY